MEKKLKKLSLSQETLRNLSRTELQDGKGAFVTGPNSCFHCTGTCPTNCACPPPR
jgi:hypothetical protein